MTLLNSKISRILVGMCLFIVSALISLYVLERVLPLEEVPQKTKKRNVYYPSNYSGVFHNIEFKYNLVTNDQGLRYHNIPLQKADDKKRIFIVGDSFTEGIGVDNNKTYPFLLEKYFSKTNDPTLFINGGYVGTGLLHYYRMIDLVGLKYNPDAIIVAIYTNDIASIPDDVSNTLKLLKGDNKFSLIKLFEDNFPRITASLKQMKITPKQKKKLDKISLFAQEARKDGVSEERIEQWQSSIPENLRQASAKGRFNVNIFKSGLLYPEFYIDSIDLSSDNARKKWKNFTTVLKEIVRIANDNDIEIAIVYIPSCFEYDPLCLTDENPWVLTGVEVRKEWLVGTNNIQKQLSEWSYENNVPFLDLTPSMRKKIESGKRLNHPLDGHWNDDGHQAAALAIEKWLSTEQVFTFFNTSVLEN